MTFKLFALALANLASLCLLLQKGFLHHHLFLFPGAVLVSGTFPEGFVLSWWVSQSSQPEKDPEVSHVYLKQSNYPQFCH